MRFIYRRILISRSIITTRSNTFTYLIYTPTNNFTTNPNVITITFTYLNPTTNNNYYTDSRWWRRTGNRSARSSNRITYCYDGYDTPHLVIPTFIMIIFITTITTTASSYDSMMINGFNDVDSDIGIDGKMINDDVCMEKGDQE